MSQHTVKEILKRIIDTGAHDTWSRSAIYNHEGKCINEKDISGGRNVIITISMGDYLKLVAAMKREGVF